MGRIAGNEKEEIRLKLLLRSVEIVFSAGRLFNCEGLRYRIFFDWDVEEMPHPGKKIRLFYSEGKNRDHFVACDLRKESSERTGDKMIVTVEELKRLEDMDIRDLRREDLDNAEDIVIEDFSVSWSKVHCCQ